MAQRRRFTAQFKTPVVLDLLTGRRSVAPLCREPDLKEQVVTRWRAVCLDRAEILFRADTEREEPLGRLAALERLVGRLTMELDLAKNASPLWGSRATRSGS
jgi:transposase-like protein